MSTHSQNKTPAAPLRAGHSIYGCSRSAAVSIPSSSISWMPYSLNAPRPRSLNVYSDRGDEDDSSPVRAVWAVGLAIATLVLIGDITITWSFNAFSVLVYYGITNLCALRLAPSERRFPRQTAAVGMICCFGLAFFVEWKVWIPGFTLILIGLAVRP